MPFHRRQRGFQGVGFGQLVVGPVAQHFAGPVVRRRTEELKKRNWAGSPTTRPISSPGTSASVPSSIPIGATHNARNGRGAPGTARPAVSMPT